MHLRWQDDAVADLCELRAYIAQDSPQASAQVAHNASGKLLHYCVSSLQWEDLDGYQILGNW